MMKKPKTLQEATQELKRSVNRLHNARLNFMRTYENTLRTERYEGDSYFQDKFGDRVATIDHTQL